MASGLLASDFEASDYVAGGTGIEYRGDLAALNLSDIPAARGQDRYAAGILRGIRAFLDR